MAKGSERRPARQKNATSGCMWGIISMFDFRHGRAIRRLLSDHRRYTDNNTHGPQYPTPEVNLHTNYQETRPRIEDGEKIRNAAYNFTRMRVREVTEEKRFIDLDLKCTRRNYEHISKTLKKSFEEEASQYHDLEALVREILLIYRKRTEQHGDIGTEAKRSFPIVEEKLIAAVEALLHEKSGNGDHKKFHDSNEMFQMLSSNKEMFAKILQDQNLLLLNEDQKSKSKGQGTDDSLVRKHRKIFRKSGSQESIPLYEKNNIVILRPACSESQVHMDNETHNDENGSQFSYVKVKRRLKHAMQNQQQTPGYAGWSSPNRDHFYTERYAKITNELKTGDRFSKSCETGVLSENEENRISNIYVEAKRHISEMVTSGDEDAKYMKRSLPALPKSLGRIFQEYNSLSPCTSPRVQPQPMLNKSHLITTSENPEGETGVLDDGTCEGDQKMVKSPSHDKEHEEQTKGCEPRDSFAGYQPSQSSEHETSHGKHSPISVLEPLFSDDDTVPASSVSLPVEATVQPQCINFDKFLSDAAYQQIRITDSGDNEESAFEYVEAVLLSSDLDWSDFETRWFSSVQILDPSLFDEVEAFSSRAKYDQKLLFDSTNEALENVCNHFIPESLFIKQNICPVPKGMDLINEVWSRLESWLFKHYPQDLNELVRNELETSRMWLNLQTGSREVVIELDNLIFEETIDNIVFEFIYR